MSERAEIFIGKKPVMNYVLASMIQFSAGVREIVIKARGRSISNAVTVAEILRRRLYEGNLDIKSVKIGSELVGEGENARYVSTIEIILARAEE